MTERTNEQLAVRFAKDAESYTDAARQLSDFHSLGPRYHLFCHATELLLKSFILASGGDESELRDLGHKLKDALVRAKSLGFQPADPDFEMFVDWLDPFHRGHDFRYARTGYQMLPTASDLLAILDRMHAQISPIARAAYIKANPA